MNETSIGCTVRLWYHIPQRKWAYDFGTTLAAPLIADRVHLEGVVGRTMLLRETQNVNHGAVAWIVFHNVLHTEHNGALKIITLRGA